MQLRVSARARRWAKWLVMAGMLSTTVFGLLLTVVIFGIKMTLSRSAALKKAAKDALVS